MEINDHTHIDTQIHHDDINNFDDHHDNKLTLSIEKYEKMVNVEYEIKRDNHNILNYIYDMATEYIEDNILHMSSENFEEVFHENLHNLLFSTIENSYNVDEELYEYLMMPEIIINRAINLIYNKYIPKRHYNTTFIRNNTEHNIERLTDKINFVQTCIQPDQRTKEWYEFRHGIITASSAWKAFDTQSLYNSLVYEKCCPCKSPDASQTVYINTETTLHWGQKYEPLSTMLYEHIYNTQIGEFGCIRHHNYSFIGASPDGINIKLGNPRYGRMLEIKNIVNREIKQNPKKEYWIQMQLQMEVLNLDECDFLETSFKEYPDEKTYRDDGNFNLSKEKQKKGVIICFNDGNKPFYEYCPLDIDNYDDYEKWRDNIIDQHDKLTWINDTYWYLKKKSCVLVRRNQKWFNSVEHKFKELWNIVLKERESGWEHRKPKSRSKKSHNVQPTLSITTPPLTAAEEPTQNKQDTPTTVFKIDTQILGDASISMDIDSD